MLDSLDKDIPSYPIEEETTAAIERAAVRSPCVFRVTGQLRNRHSEIENFVSLNLPPMCGPAKAGEKQRVYIKADQIGDRSTWTPDIPYYQARNELLAHTIPHILDRDAPLPKIICWGKEKIKNNKILLSPPKVDFSDGPYGIAFEYVDTTGFDKIDFYSLFSKDPIAFFTRFLDTAIQYAEFQAKYYEPLGLVAKDIKQTDVLFTKNSEIFVLDPGFLSAINQSGFAFLKRVGLRSDKNEASKFRLNDPVTDGQFNALKDFVYFFYTGIQPFESFSKQGDKHIAAIFAETPQELGDWYKELWLKTLSPEVKRKKFGIEEGKLFYRYSDLTNDLRRGRALIINRTISGPKTSVKDLIDLRRQARSEITR